jgi:DNA-binding MarR family transcriptional regulator
MMAAMVRRRETEEAEGTGEPSGDATGPSGGPSDDAGGRSGGPGGPPVGVAFLLSQLGIYAAQQFAARMTTIGLTPPLAGLLRAIAVTPGQSQQALARYLRTQPSRVVAFVDDLEGRGLIERRRNPQDRRLHAIHLTQDGHEALHQIGQLARANDADLCAPLDDDERQQLISLLQRLRAHHGLTPGVHPGYRLMGKGGPDCPPD